MNWSYEEGACGPFEWCNYFPNASGKNQSPINIDTKKIDANNITEDKKIIFKYNPHNLRILRNTGRTWQVTNEGVGNEIYGGPLNSTYRLLQIHAHWGSNDNEGSEHIVDGRQYSGELHLVHWNTNYANVEEAVKYSDGLCVLAVLFKLGQPNIELEKICNHMNKILHADTGSKIKPLNPKNLLPDKFEYWTYQGSLTTPPCCECVIWIIFSEPIDVSHEQLESFRKLRYHHEDDCTGECEDRILFNNRPVLPVGERTVSLNSASKILFI